MFGQGSEDSLNVNSIYVPIGYNTSFSAEEKLGNP
jgi:hypothetical protein